MNVELICVGSELLSGDVVNTNAAYISQKLQELGHDSFRQFTVDDNKYRLSELVEQALKRCDILIVTGGLGPTADDITKETVCETLGIQLVDNEFCRNHLNKYFASSGRTPTENNYKQATAPKDAIIFANDVGTACGMCIEDGEKRVILLPGPPRELTRMFENHVIPYLKGLSHHAIVSHTLNVFGIGESSIETIIKPFCEQSNPVVATYCGNNECAVKITATADSEDAAESLCAKAMLNIRGLLGDFIYGADSQGLACEVVGLLRSKNMKISTAESCTGGMLSQSLTSVSHASEVVEIGILAYSNRIKQEALSVPAEIIDEFGAISPETAMHLAKNVRLLSESDIGVSITGNAGPTASEEKPVGLVYIGLADKDKYYIKKLTLSPEYDREKIRSYATLAALDVVRRYISSTPFGLPEMVSFDEPFPFEEDNANDVFVAKPATFLSDDEPETEPEPINTVFDPNMNFVVFDPEEEAEAPSETVEMLFDDFVVVDEPPKKDDKPAAKPVKVKNFFAKLISTFIPTKKDKSLDIVIKIVSIVALIGLITSSSVLVFHFAESNKQMNIIEDAREEFDFANIEKNTENNQFVSFNELYAQNPDIKAWIEIPGNEKINNPVYQAADNDYYLTHNMLRKKSRYGALFFDEKNSITENGNNKNLTIYGHSMKDNSMFASLLDYKSLKYYKTHPVIKLKTLFDQSDYVIFSVMITAGSSADDNGNLYKFYRSNFESDEDFMNWIAEAKERSLINATVNVDTDDEILTLATCCYDFENARFVIMAKKLDAGEPVPNVDASRNNPNVRYPQAWYDKNGLEGYNPESDIPSSAPESSEPTGSEPPSDETSSDQTSSDVTSSQAPPASNCKHEMSSDVFRDATIHRYLCAKCEGVVSEAHKFTVEKSTDAFKKADATCAAPTTYYKSCACGAKGTDTFTVGETLPHTFGDWTTVKDATDTEAGSKERVCSGCKKKETEVIPATGASTPPSTPTEPGDNLE